ncbi:uncharacterized protein M421DRAFT_224067 [Didymella exigua CBS 183.55]|uniref:Survival motor neuron Tudor domain-containing protein n=1 Tax=Didymella exigua CBS 183.55 TaxID=1150837 RepID=A0A6A5RHX6_9PLEO|nr:uncharacterized protein M421DRAFT_224067 [Didymella exigua CBS 183.55]KAF1926056.1 hypothetical protein M421DRAFT_224067 [Didymella exigua CBS 183.55]
MAPGIDISDKNAWDDSFLQDSWNGAVAEYEKYHSIAKSGKRLEDVLSKEELKELQAEYGDLIGDAEDDGEIVEANGNSDQMDTENSMQEPENVEQDFQAELQLQETTASEEQNQPQSANAGTTAPHDNILAAMPQALLGTVQDENLKNVMISWYYAGYYTGLHAGQQLPKTTPPQQ